MKKTPFILGGIVVLALILRLIGIKSLPLYGDELTMVYDTYSILKTGKDQLGNFIPLTFKMGEGRPAGYVYVSLPFVAIFGPTTLGVRSLSVLSGLGIIVLLYFLGKKLFSEKVGLIASFLAAISPWDLSLSRGGFEAHFALFLALLGIVLALFAHKKPWYFVAASISLGLTFFTYPTYKVVLPLFLSLLLLIPNLRKNPKKPYPKHLVIGGLILILFFLLAFLQTFFNQSEARFFNINLFADQDLKEKIVQQVNYDRSVSNLKPQLSQFMHNKPLEYSKLLLTSYMNNFSPDFLFLKGDGNPRHNMTGLGYFYWVEIVFIFLGVLTLSKKTKDNLSFLIGWVIVSVVATTLILVPHGLRNSFMLPPIIILSASGFNYLLERIGKKNFIILLLVFIVWGIEIILVLNNLYFVSPNKYADFWSWSARKVVDEINRRQDDYDYIFLSNRIDNAEYAYQVYNRIDPRKVIEQKGFPVGINGIKFKNFGKVYIGTIPLDKYDDFFGSLVDKKVLYLASIEEVGGLKDFELFYTPDNLPTYIVKSFR